MDTNVGLCTSSVFDPILCPPFRIMLGLKASLGRNPFFSPKAFMIDLILVAVSLHSALGSSLQVHIDPNRDVIQIKRIGMEKPNSFADH